MMVTILFSRNERLRVYDSRTENRIRWWDSRIPFIPIAQNEWDERTGTFPEVLQLFWMTEQLLDVFANNLGTNFNNVRAHWFPGLNTAKNYRGKPNEECRIAFGAMNFGEGNSTVEYDIIGHELAHSMLRTFFDHDRIENTSLHEGLSDILGTYVESILEGDIDWIIGDNIPFVIRDL